MIYQEENLNEMQKVGRDLYHNSRNSRLINSGDGFSVNLIPLFSVYLLGVAAAALVASQVSGGSGGLGGFLPASKRASVNGSPQNNIQALPQQPPQPQPQNPQYYHYLPQQHHQLQQQLPQLQHQEQQQHYQQQQQEQQYLQPQQLQQQQQYQNYQFQVPEQPLPAPQPRVNFVYPQNPSQQQEVQQIQQQQLYNPTTFFDPSPVDSKEYQASLIDQEQFDVYERLVNLQEDLRKLQEAEQLLSNALASRYVSTQTAVK